MDHFELGCSSVKLWLNIGGASIVSVLFDSWRWIWQINYQKKKTGVIAPKRFVQRVKKQNELFRSYMHQVIEYFPKYMVCYAIQALLKPVHFVYLSLIFYVFVVNVVVGCA